jgi:acyl carrier protein
MKQTLIPEEKVLEEVRRAVWEGLDTDPAKVRPESSLIGDLGAESLDFLDINYRLEQTFGIKTARHSVIEHMEEMFGEESALDSEGKLTEKAAKVLSLRFNDSADQLRAGMDMEELPRLVTVKSIADGVLDILDTLPPNCTQCGKNGWTIEKESRIQCGSCGEQAEFTEGDELVDTWLTQIQEKEKIF